MSNGETNSELLNELAHQFSEQLRRGEQPAVEHYAQTHPKQADEIRELFPMLLLMEQIDQSSQSVRGKSIDLLPTPQRLGEYRIVRRLGRGGMGTVYEAVQESLGRRVALKVLPVHTATDPRLPERFKREARAAANLHHTNIVPVFGVGEDQGVYYYAMQFIAGESLDHSKFDRQRTQAARQGSTEVGRQTDSLAPPIANVRYPEEPTPVPTTDGNPPCLGITDDFRMIARIGSQVADALAYAHAHGVLHRDIKPANILLDELGIAWVSDFGLAKIEGLEELTMVDDVLGTLQYVPPERFRGQTDARGDIYSLGLTLYQLLVGQAAFTASTRAELVRRILQDSPPSPRRLNRNIPLDLETIVLKATANDPDARYQTAAELAEDLRRFLADRPIQARRQTTAEQWRRWWRKNPLLALSGTTAAVLLIVVAAVSTLSYVREKNLGDSLQAALRRAQQAEVQGRNELYSSYVSSAEAARLSRRQGQRYNSLAAIRNAAQLLPSMNLSTEEQQQYWDELRDLAITCLTLPDVREIGHAAQGEALDFYRLDRSARRDAHASLIVKRWPAGDELARLRSVSEQTWFGFTPERDEMILVDQQADRLLRWRLTDSEPQLVAQLQRHAGKPSYVEFRDRRVALVHENDSRGLIEILDWPSGELRLRQELPHQNNIIKAARLSPNGRLLAMIQGQYGGEASRLVRVFDVDVSAEVAMLEHVDSVSSAAWHPDSQTLAVGLTNSNDIVLWNVSEKKRLATLNNQRGGGPHVCMSANGELLCSTSLWAGTADIWHPYTRRRLLHLPDLWQFEWNTLNGFVVAEAKAADGGWDYIEAEPSPVMKTLVRNPVHGDVSAWRFLSAHPEGQLLAVGSDNGVTLFDLGSGLEAAHLPVGYSLCPLFIPETGDLLTYSEQGLIRWQCSSGTPEPTLPSPPSSQPSSSESTRQPGSVSSAERVDGSQDAASRVSPTAIEVRTADGESRRFSPTRLPCPAIFGAQVASNRSGKVIAAAAGKSVVVLHNYGERIVTLGPLLDCRGLAVSPEGRWVVTTNHDGGPIDVWDAASGALLHHVGESPSAPFSCFSPDGQWLSLQTSAPSRLRTGTWQEASVDNSGESGFLCYSPDGRLAIRLERTGAILCDARTGRKLATLSTPDAPAIRYATFTHDSRRVVLNSDEQHETYVWDLPTLAGELAQLGFPRDETSELSRRAYRPSASMWVKRPSIQTRPR